VGLSVFTLLDDGTVRCLGKNTKGACGVGDTSPRTAPVSVPLGRPARVVAAGGFACAVLENGSVSCWGDSSWSLPDTGFKFETSLMPTVIPGVEGAVDVAVGLFSACARTLDGRVFCWGDNEGGALGDGTKVGRSQPAQVRGIGDAIGIAVGAKHACARTRDAKVYCWGHGEAESVMPQEVAALRGASVVVAGDQSTFAALADGRVVKVVGVGRVGEPGKWQDVGAKVVDALTDVVDLAIRGVDARLCARTREGRVFCCSEGVSILGVSDRAALAEYLAGPPTKCMPSEVPFSARARALAAGVGDDLGCAILSNDSVRCWGYSQDTGDLRIDTAVRY
jgi:hypothetical protein